MLTLKICVGVFSGIFKARMFKFGIHMDNELLYYGIENRTHCLYSSLYLSIFLSSFLCFLYLKCLDFVLQFSLQLIYCSFINSSALLKHCSGAIVRFSDSSSFCTVVVLEEEKCHLKHFLGRLKVKVTGV